ncbi:innexin shaking-B isoform X3 [Ceratina calcarata]|uniref:Innexin n=1 Tax=Ceratina calcarata TaxID=156304 RepID=A0AAJ7WGR3_9HYME|nr:innexin shaking-B isoform X3 [Ceratina calcarata]
MPLLLKMVDVFGSLRSLLKFHRVSVDTMVFRLHYRATVALLLGGCVTLACKSISGSPIHCEASGSVDKIVLETFCWLHTTYSMVHAFNMSLGQAVPYPGVSNSKGDGLHGHAPHPLVKQHKYYQWVIFFLLVQAILFYTPRWLWKGWEGGKIHALMMDLDIGLCSEVEKKQKKKMLLDYLWENLRYHNWWAYRYYLCEVLALLNVIDVSNEPVLRWCVSDVWYRRAQVPRVRSGGPGRSDDLRVPADDQVHLLQIRRQRRGREARCSLHTPTERRQREDIRIPLVLVPLSRHAQFHHGFIQDRYHIFAANEGVPPTLTVSSGPKGRRGDDRATEQSGRLVSALHARREFGHGDIQGRDARPGEQARLEAPP